MAAQAKRIGESKIIAARAEVESAKLMRKAADILNSPAAMQIRYLEAQQQIAKTAGAKVIFLPGNASGPSQFGEGAGAAGKAPQSYVENDDLDATLQKVVNSEVLSGM